MAVRDDLAAIDADGSLDGEQRRRAKARRKAEAIRDLLDNAAERTFTRGQFSVTINDPVVGQRQGVPFIKMHLLVRRNQNVRFNDDWVIVNPPILVPDGEEANPDHDPDNPLSRPTRPKFREDLREALRTAIADLIADLNARR